MSAGDPFLSPTRSLDLQSRRLHSRAAPQRLAASLALRIVVVLSCVHCLYEFAEFLFPDGTRSPGGVSFPARFSKQVDSAVSDDNDADSLLQKELPDFRNPPMDRLERLYATTDDIFRLIDDNLQQTHRSRKKYGYSPYPVECHNKVLCGPREENRRKQESISRALATVADFQSAKRRLYIDLGGRSYDSSVGWFLENYPMTFDHVHVFEADEKFGREYRGRANMTFHSAIVTDIDGSAVTAEDGCHWIKTPHSSEVSSGRRRLLQVPKVSEPRRAIDFSRWLQQEVTTEDLVVVKMDIEGEEYSLLPKMIEDGSIKLVSELFLETHNLRFNRHPCIGADKTREDSYNLLKSLRDGGVYVHEWY